MGKLKKDLRYVVPSCLLNVKFNKLLRKSQDFWDWKQSFVNNLQLNFDKSQ